MSNNAWTPNETWEEALSRSKEIRGPSDVKPVKWSCNPERKWVHLTESEWIGLHEAFHEQKQRLLALQNCISDLHFEMSQLIDRKQSHVMVDLPRWIKLIEDGRRGVWPPAVTEEADSTD